VLFDFSLRLRKCKVDLFGCNFICNFLYLESSTFPLLLYDCQCCSSGKGDTFLKI
jgi:hypothetical protein